VPQRGNTWTDDEAREYASLLDLANDAVLVLDLEGNIRFWNRGAERLYGWTREEALGKNSHALLRTQFPVSVQQILNEVRARGEWRGEIHNVTRDGYAVMVATRWTPRIGPDGHISGTFEINRDITEERRRQEHIRTAERLANLGRLAATVAHEINNPLDVLNNLLFLLKQEPLSDTARDLIEHAEIEVKCIADITNATLRYSRNALNPVPTSLRDVLENVLAMYSARLRSRRIEVEKHYRSEGNVTARAGELRQIFANLVGNALDALSDGGRMRISLTPAGDRGFRVVVADNGSGIPPAVRERMYEPFYTTKGASGTGLGLWIARDFIEKQGGSIHVRSRTQPGRSGTVFLVVIPHESKTNSFEASVA
jgi:PAS domain S-box-containing protein